MKINRLLVAVLAMLFVNAAIWGQSVSTSQVSGVVTDQTGAIVPDAQVQMTQTDTGLNRSATTNADGYYVLPALPVGPYRLDVTKQGFNAYVQTGIVLQVSSNPVLNVTLGVGAVSTEVSVQANAQMVETESNGVGTVVENQRVEELPLNGRELTSLISLSGAATPAIGGDYNSNKNYPTFGTTGTIGGSPGGALSIAGGLPTGVTYILDGGTHNDPFNNLNLPLPFPDATQEFKLETSSLPAQYGDHADAAVNVVTKSGTNSFHGDAFEFVRNFMFNAREADQATRDSLKRNQYGGTFGGPIKKDKIFFFAGFQGTIQKSNPTSTTTFMPTNQEMGNVTNDPNCAVLPGAPTQCLDFTALTNPANSACNANTTAFGAAANTVTGGGPMRGAFLDNPALGYLSNVAPLSALGPSSTQPGLALANALYGGLPASQKNLGLGPTTYSATPTNPCGAILLANGANLNEQLGVGRLDYQISSKQTIFGRYLMGNSDQPLVGTAVLQIANKIVQKNRAQSLVIGDTYTGKPNVVNSLHLTALRTRNVRNIAPFFQPSTFGINDTADGKSFIPEFLAFSIANGASGAGGATNPGHFNTTALQAADDVDVIHGSHQITFGINYIHTIMDTENSRTANGVFGFSSGQASSSATGIGYGDLLTGNLDSFTQGNPDIENDGQHYIGLYIQDSWKATRRLTLNYGLRWEPYLPMTNSNHHAQLFDIANFVNRIGSAVYQNSPAGLLYAGDHGFPGDSYQSGKIDDIAPRFGVVWDPKGDGKMAIRAGYGIFYDSPYMFFGTRVSNSPPFGSTTGQPTAANLGITPLAGTAGGVSTLLNPWTNYPGGIPFPALSQLSPTVPFPTEGVYVSYPEKTEVTYLEQWNLSIQKQIGSWLFSGSYLGTDTKHLPTAFEGDPGVNIPGTVKAGNCTVGTAATLGGVFVGGAYNGIPDGLTSAGNGFCSQTSNANNRRVLYLAAPPPGSAAAVATLNPVQFPGIFYATIGTLDQSGVASYNGLLLSVQHRLAHNFSFSANWTYSHCLSDAETGTQNDLAGPTYEVPGFENLSYANCDSDVRHTINITAVANTPRFGNRIANAILGGWQVSPIITWRTGTYTTVTVGPDYAESGIGGQIAQQLSTNFYSPAKGQFTSGNCGPDAIAAGTCNAFKFQVAYLNNTQGAGCNNGQGLTATQIGAWGCPGPATATACSGSTPTVTVNGGTYACTPPDTVENPGLFEFDMALVRSFKIRESKSLQFRWEVFNVPNKVNLGTIGGASLTTSASSFGVISSAGAPRIMQFALKFVF
jgi:Carboxypeptidase regulatory-like domain